MHVLIIDDNGLHLKMCRILLEKLKHQVSTADSFASLKKNIINISEPDVCLVDFRLEPGVTGVDVLHFLKSDTQWKKTKYVALTADVGEKTYLDGSGFHGVIFKPITEGLLAETLKKYE